MFFCRHVSSPFSCVPQWGGMCTCYGTPVVIKGQPQLLVLGFHLVWDGSRVHGCTPQAKRPAGFQWVSVSVSHLSWGCTGVTDVRATASSCAGALWTQAQTFRLAQQVCSHASPKRKRNKWTDFSEVLSLRQHSWRMLALPHKQCKENAQQPVTQPFTSSLWYPDSPESFPFTV